MYFAANNTFNMSTPVSFLSLGSSKLQFDTLFDLEVLTVYLLIDNSTLAVHKVDFFASNNT